MQLKRSAMKDALEGRGDFVSDRLWVIPLLQPISEADEGNASLDLRLGRWFVTLLQSHQHILDFTESETGPDNQFARKDFIRFDATYILHPGRFVLGITLEWVRIPTICAGSIVGKSSLGRRGLIIETAPVIHPAFSGCLTLELANVGEVPIALHPGMEIAQLQIYRTEGKGAVEGRFQGYRRPTLGKIKTDAILRSLKSGKFTP